MAIDADAGPPDFGNVEQFVRRYHAVVAAVSVVTGIAAYIGSFAFTEVYRAEVLVSPVSQEQVSSLESLAGQVGGLGSLAGLIGLQLPTLTTEASTTIAMLRSRSFIEDFIDENDLLPTLFSEDWDSTRAQWRTSDPEDIPTLQDGYELFTSSVLSVIEDRESNLYTIRVDWSDRFVAAAWANELIMRVNEAARLRAITESERSIEFLTKELEVASTLQLRQSIFSLLQSRLNKRMLANTRPEFAFSIIDPALPSDEDKYVWPMRLLFAVLGAFGGGVVAIISCLLVTRSRASS